MLTNGPAWSHAASDDPLCVCDACQEEHDPPAFRQWLRVAESRNRLLGWGRQPPAPPGVAPWAFGYAAVGSIPSVPTATVRL